MTTSTALPPAGWYSDPWGVAQWRWWDGGSWTGYTDQWYRVHGVAPASAPVVDDTRPIRGGWIALAGMAIGIALSFAAYLVPRALGVASDNPVLILFAQLGLWTGLLGACVVAVRRRGTGSLRDLGWRFKGIDPALGLGFGVAMLVGVGRIAVFIQSIGIEPKRGSLLDPIRRSPLSVGIIVLIAVVGAPIVEELFFRGLLMSGLIVRFGVAGGIVTQAVLFGMVHLGPTDHEGNFDLLGNLGVFLLIAPVGVVLGLLRWRYKRLGPGIFTHGVYNAIIMLVALSRLYHW